MPLREYFCAACGRTFEWLERKKNDHPKGCLNCGDERVSVIPSAGAFTIDGQFSGSRPKPKKGK